MAQYTEDDVAAAIQDVRNGKPIRRAAKDWGVPKTTLIDRLSGRESSREAAISQQRLSPVQEKHLTDWVLTQEALGLAPTHAQIKELAERVLALKGGHTPLGKNWIAAFFRRNPILRTKRQRRIDSQRINGASTEVIRSWFPKLRIPAIQAIKPENRYNMDEHGIMEGQGGNGLVVGSAAIRAIHQKQPGSRHGPPFWSVYPRLAEPSLPSLFTKAKPSNSNGSLPTYVNSRNGTSRQPKKAGQKTLSQ